MAFRGAAKSTRAEEAICIRSWFQREKNVLILGDSEQRAVERLRAIKNIIETNAYAQELFGVGPGSIWNDGQAVLSNGVMLQAYGRGQSLRGVKHLDWRPSLIFMDDLEDKESVATPEARNKTLVWYVSTVVPALDSNGRMRMAATPLHPEALAPKLAASESWTFKTYPIIYRNPKGTWVASWPEKYPVQWALNMRQEMKQVGKEEEFDQEYMCQARNPATQVFTPDMIRVVPHLRSWHAVYAMYDPARTKGEKSATTGKAVWSWIGRKLVIWDGFGRQLMPDEIIDDMFAVEREFSPVAIGFEEDGLNEWALQPIRTAQVQRGVTLPLRPLKAPKGKIDFIKGLQPYFKAGEVEFATELPGDMREQLLGFPTGKMDFPNALAYALKMRLGLPIYDGFAAEHIAPQIRPAARAPLWLALNSDGRVTTAILVQVHQGQVAIIADWLAEGAPGEVLPDIMQSASMETPTIRSTGGKTEATTYQRSTLRLVAPRPHFEAYDTIGLRPAARKLPADVQRGGDLSTGREEIRSLFQRSAHGQPSLQIAESARWTLRAFAGGYARDATSDHATEGPYRVLMEGLEAFTAMLRGVGLREDDSERNYSHTPGGQRYLSARAR
jgi:hypothetical protein